MTGAEGPERKRVTLMDVAAAARVSKATVDRVFNGRGGVKARTRSQVMAAAVDLGYLSAAEAASRPLAERGEEPCVPEERPVRLDFVLPGGAGSFMTRMTGELERAGAAWPGVELHVSRIRGFDPDSLAEALSGRAGHADGVGVIGVDHPSVREAIRALARSGTPVLTLVSDISNVATIGYIGIDNRSAGRLAGHLLGRFVGRRRGAVALFAGALSYRGHEEREMGFRHILDERFPDLPIAVQREVGDDPERAYGEAKAVLAETADLVGIYNIGAGNRGIGQALEEAGRAGDVVFIGHDLSEHTRSMLLSGVMDVAIDQNPREQARLSVARLVAAARGREVPPPPEPLQILPIFSENIPGDFGR